MKTNDMIHGFTVRYVEEVPELQATLYRMEYEKNGADLVWLDRNDDNKTFSIAFKTIPQDDTGVFHILEHSVLCGSKKYPVKEPFVELIKSSLQTFLNAFTFPDKTMYPLCSRNNQDFLNLIDVYMDAVLHPLSVQSPLSFRQEGWHYELDGAEGELTCNGVVYNEMKGAYASPGTILEAEINRLLFPDTCYGFESGGHPDHITELTYENYLDSHKRFYHPSNARIFLDGNVDLDAVLAKLDGFLQEYDRLEPDAEIPMQTPVSPAEKTCYYEIGAQEDPENKVILSDGWVFGNYAEQEKNIACSVLADVLCGSNDAPLTKAILERGLAEDVEFHMDLMQQFYAFLEVRNTSKEKCGQVRQVIEDTLRALATNGIDKKRLHAVLNHMEFTTKEKDFGSWPRGLIYAMSSLESWLYGGDPVQNLCYDETFQKLREGIDKGYFEQFIRENLLDNPHHARLLLLPSKTLGEEKQQKEKERLSAIKEQWSKAEIEQVIEEFGVLRAHQEAPDLPEQLAALPVLSLDDIPEAVDEVIQEVISIDGVTLLHHPMETDGIVYLDLYFSLADIELSQMSRISFFSTLLGQVATEQHSAIELRSEIEGNLGRFTVSPTVFAKSGQTTQCKPYLAVSVSVLESRMTEAVRLIDEILNTSTFTDQRYIYNLLRQTRIGLEQQVIGSGNSFAAQRVGASFSAKGAVTDALRGIGNLRWIQKTDQSFEAAGTSFCTELAALPRKLFSRERLTVSVTGPLDQAWISQLLAILPAAPMGNAVQYTPNPVCHEGIQIPAEVGFAVKSANLNGTDGSYSGSALVAAHFLTYDYLWNEVRVKGGAYGTGLSVRVDGDVNFTSYRDPGAPQSLLCYDRAGAALREFCNSEEPLDKYIISTIGETEPVRTPRMEGNRAAALYFNERTKEDRQQLRSEILHTSREDLRRFSQVLDQICMAAGICVIGGKAALDACGDTLEHVEMLRNE